MALKDYITDDAYVCDKAFTLEWCKTYDVLHTVKTGERSYAKKWDRLTFCRYVANKTKIEFYNSQTEKRCRLSITAIECIFDDYYQYFLNTGHKQLIKRLKGDKI